MKLIISALRHPITVLVAVLGIAFFSYISIRNSKIDIFPTLGLPTVYVAQPYGGLSPEQMEGFVTSYYEYHFLYITGVKYVDSKSIQGAALIKIEFNEGTDMAQAMAEVVGYVNRSRAFMPPGTVPPFITRFDAGSVPVGQLVFSSETKSLGEISDLALFKVRPMFSTLPGVSAPPPFGGNNKTVIINVDPDKIRNYQLSPGQVMQSLATSNTISPAGNVRIGDSTYLTPQNSVIENLQDLENTPLQKGSGTSVYIKDIATVSIGSDVTTSYALVNGKRSVYIPVTKRADASTWDVVKLVKASLPDMQAAIPEDIKVSYEFDQSGYVISALKSLLFEGGLGAILTGLMVLLFLGDRRGALIVVMTIPLALLCSATVLYLFGQTINIMTLGGLALSVGILVDEATVTIENIHRHLEMGKDKRQAIADACKEIATPKLLILLSILAVFVPPLFMNGVPRAMFMPLSLAVGFAMIASFFLSQTFVPVLSNWMMKGHLPQSSSNNRFERLKISYTGTITRISKKTGLITLLFSLVSTGFVIIFFLSIGTELFPAVDTGQTQVTANVAITLLKGKDLVIQMPNPKMLAIWQRNLEDVAGRKLVDVFPELEFQRFPKLLTDAFETGNRVAMDQIPAVIVDTNGKSHQIYVDFSYDPIFDSIGNVEYIMATVIDVTKQVESFTELEQNKAELQAITEELATSNEELSATNEELATTNEELQEAQESLLIKNEELAETEENLNLALASGNLGIYSIYPSTGKFDISKKAREFYGLPLETDVLWTDVIKTVVPEYLSVIEKARADALAKHIPFDVQYPIIQGSTGIKKWVRVVGKSIPKTKLKEARFLGVIIDITEEVEHRLVIEESEDRFRNMAEATDIYISVGDLSRKATYFNNAWVKLTGRTMQELVELGYIDLVHPEDRNIYMDVYNKSFDKQSTFTGEFRLMGLDGEYRWLLAKGTPRFNNDGIFMGYISSSVDITELKKDELRKNDFIGMVSHELKTPLTAISGFVQVLQSRARKSEDTYALNALNRAYNQIRKMTSMINGFLNVSRLESGKLLIEKNVFRLDELLVELIEESDIVQFSHEIILSVDEPIEVNADRDKIGSVVSNLLSNAVKYSPSGTRVDVKCKILNNKAFVSVSDNGIGIDKIDLEKLFDRYYRVGKHHTVSGFGIGLYLSAEIIERHNGKIGVDSEVDKGSTFYFEIPLIEH
ncbi:efflux RND transporter permease subunit [Pedobacter jejuensis]|uniref:histidine kinase n=1 Tax=Pedobacter jejuensis TaxID=1268550 RepID=A0A3N0BXX5_9SPHI|nr:efflux RND transporter permease subunit [Pedobacter jejuensis]RNL54601.1 PAS domain S-box protein [Pedobacter jejuensis]